MKRFAVSLVFGLVALSGLATADQRDARLVELFERLHRSEDSREIVHLQSGIWSIWTESAGEESNALMYDGLLAMRGKRYEVALERFDALVKHDAILRKAGTSGRRFFICLAVTKVDCRYQTGTGVGETPLWRLSGLGLCYEALGDEAAAVKAYQLALEAIRISIRCRQKSNGCEKRSTEEYLAT